MNLKRSHVLNANIQLAIHNLKDMDGQSVHVDLDENMLLDPFYASIRDIELYFDESVVFTESFISRLNEIIFNKSIYIDAYLSNKRINLKPEDLYWIKREYVICAVAYDASKHIYAGSLKSSKVKKELGDFIVERDVTFNLSSVSQISNDAKSCADDIISEIDSMTTIIAEGFVKGQFNKANDRSDRLWHHPNHESRVPIAADKYRESDGRYYKTGVAHAHK